MPNNSSAFILQWLFEALWIIRVRFVIVCNYYYYYIFFNSNTKIVILLISVSSPQTLTQLVPFLSLCRWIPQCQRRSLHLFISSLQLAALISPLHVNRSWSAHAQSQSTHPTWLLPPSQSVWVPVSLAPVSIWKALYGKKQRTVRRFRDHVE